MKRFPKRITFSQIEQSIIKTLPTKGGISASKLHATMLEEMNLVELIRVMHKLVDKGFVSCKVINFQSFYSLKKQKNSVHLFVE